jgi:manganese catalase
LTHNYFLETGARNNKLKVYEMVEHPAARALTGYLLVRGGVHQVAYARAIEHLTGAKLMKMFPSPRIPTEKIPESQPHIERGEHTKLYRFSEEDFHEVAAVWNGTHPETGDELVVANLPHPEGVPAHDLPPQPASSLQAIRSRRSPRLRRSCASRPACPTSPPESSRRSRRGSSKASSAGSRRRRDPDSKTRAGDA